MDWEKYFVPLISLVAVVVTAVFGLLANRQKFREDLQAKYDANIHQQRTDVYLPLWQELEVLARYAAPGRVTEQGLNELSNTLRHWFFHTGGLFLSDDSRQAYLDLQSAIRRQVGKEAVTDQEVIGEHLKHLQDKASVLRAHLSKDLGSRKLVKIRS